MGLDDMINGAKRDGEDFLGRNGNVFFALGGAIFGVFDGFRSYGSPDPMEAFMTSALWFWALWPTVMLGIYSYKGLPTGPIAKHLYLSQGPENTVSFTIPYLAAATIAHGIKTSF